MKSVDYITPPKESLRDKKRGNYRFEVLALPLLSGEGVGG